LSVLLMAISLQAATFCINYSATPDVAALRRYDFSILSPEAQVDVAELKRSGHGAYAYLSVVELAKTASYRAEVAALKIPLLGKNDVWLGDFVDVSHPAWTDFVVNTLAARAAQKGYLGFFLDTVDSVELLEQQHPLRAAAFRDGLVRLIKSLKARYPDRKIIVNRGFPLLARLTGAVDGVLAESLFRKFNFSDKRYVAVEPQGTAWLLERLHTVSRAGLPVYVVDYVDPVDLPLAEATARKITAEGFFPFISTVELDGKFLAPRPAAPGTPPPPFHPPATGAVSSFPLQPPEVPPALPPFHPVATPRPSLPVTPPRPVGPALPGEVPRTVLTLFGNQDPDVEELVRWPIDTGMAQVGQMPLEWLGYEVEYLNIGRASSFL